MILKYKPAQEIKIEKKIFLSALRIIRISSLFSRIDLRQL